MDDSGTHDGSHNCVVAGYWGGVNEWRRFERAWREVLSREGISEFKANEFWPRIKDERIGPYRGWTDARHRRFIAQLLKVIFQAKIYPFGSGVLAADWQAQPLHIRQVITLANVPTKAKPMFVSFQRNLYRAASYCLPGVRMNFVFDESSTRHIQAGILRCFNATKRLVIEEKHPLSGQLGSISFEDSASAPPLQAADLLAYEMHRYAKQERHGVNEMRDVYKIALLHMKSNEDFWLFDQPRLERINRLFQEKSSA